MDHLAELALMVIFAGLFIALINGGWNGPGGATAWFRAKFMGRPS